MLKDPGLISFLVIVLPIIVAMVDTTLVVRILEFVDDYENKQEGFFKKYLNLDFNEIVINGWWIGGVVGILFVFPIAIPMALAIALLIFQSRRIKRLEKRLKDK